MKASRSHRVFLRLADLSQSEHRALFRRAKQLKARRLRGVVERSLEGRTLGLVFEKPSTRTRVSFEAAMFQLGGHAINLPQGESQMSRGEPIQDTARVLSRYLDVIVMRTFGDDRLEAFASAATVPVINGLSDGAHPVQLLADLFTIEERLGRVRGLLVAFVGDGSSNMARSWVEAARLFDFKLRIASPRRYRPPGSEIAEAGTRLTLHLDPREAARDADVVATDVWTNMGQEAEAAQRRRAFRGIQVNQAVLDAATPECLLLHCLPAHRGEEIDNQALEGPHSVVFDEAENRLHVQKALLEQLLLR
ncbi:MAG: ornithine carbamoyltransferase [Solirubrobacterales bacterium]